MGKKQKQNKKREKRHNSKSIEKGKTQNFIASKEESDRNYKWKNLTPRHTATHTHTHTDCHNTAALLTHYYAWNGFYFSTNPLATATVLSVFCLLLRVWCGSFSFLFYVVKSPFREGGSCCGGRAARKAAGTPKGLPRC